MRRNIICTYTKTNISKQIEPVLLSKLPGILGKDFHIPLGQPRSLLLFYYAFLSLLSITQRLYKMEKNW